MSIAIGLLQGKYREEGKTNKSLESMDADRMVRYVNYVNDNLVDKEHRRTNEVDYAAKNDRNRFHGNGIIDQNAPLGNLMVETVCGAREHLLRSSYSNFWKMRILITSTELMER